MTLPSAAEDLRLANRNLQAGLESLRLSRKGLTRIRAQDLSALRNEVRHVAHCIRSLSADFRDAELEKEISQCRGNLEQLAQVLPRFHLELQAQKKRLQSLLARMQRVAAWADANQKSL